MSISTGTGIYPHGNIVYTANDFRQTLRIVFAGMIALSISSFYNTSYGVFCGLPDHAAVSGTSV